MAKRTVVVLHDDLDGTEGAETHEFYASGAKYEIDLSPANAKRLGKAVADAEKLLAEFVNHATRVATATGRGGRGGAAAARAGRASEREQNKAIRAWALRKGLDVAPRGRIRAEVIEQYHREAGKK